MRSRGIISQEFTEVEKMKIAVPLSKYYTPYIRKLQKIGLALTATGTATQVIRSLGVLPVQPLQAIGAISAFFGTAMTMAQFSLKSSVAEKASPEEARRIKRDAILDVALTFASLAPFVAPVPGAILYGTVLGIKAANYFVEGREATQKQLQGTGQPQLQRS